MAKITADEKHVLELLFEGSYSGLVLDFDRDSFIDFFAEEFGIDITASPYYAMKPTGFGYDFIAPLRKFYKTESDRVVGRAIQLLVARAMRMYDNGNREYRTLELIKDGYLIAGRLQGIELSQQEKSDMGGNEGMDSVAKKLKEISFDKMPIEDKFKPILKNRLDEAVLCYKNETYLATIVMAGSVLEGALLGYATKHPEKFENAKNIDTLPLAKLIDVCEKAEILSKTARGFSDAVRSFRNYIHPYGQISDKFEAGKEDAEDCLLGLNAILRRLK